MEISYNFYFLFELRDNPQIHFPLILSVDLSGKGLKKEMEKYISKKGIGR